MSLKRPIPEEIKINKEKKPRRAADIPEGFFDSHMKNDQKDSDALEEEWERFERDIAQVEAITESKNLSGQLKPESLLPNMKATIEASPVGLDGKETILDRRETNLAKEYNRNVGDDKLEEEEEQDAEEAMLDQRYIQQELLGRIAALKEKRTMAIKNKLETEHADLQKVQNYDIASTGNNNDDEQEEEENYSDEDIFKMKGSSKIQ